MNGAIWIEIVSTRFRRDNCATLFDFRQPKTERVRHRWMRNRAVHNCAENLEAGHLFEPSVSHALTLS